MADDAVIAHLAALADRLASESNVVLEDGVGPLGYNIGKSVGLSHAAAEIRRLLKGRRTGGG